MGGGVSGEMWDMIVIALGRYEVDGNGESDPGTYVVVLLILGAPIAPQVEVDEVYDCDTASSDVVPVFLPNGKATTLGKTVFVTDFVIVRVDCCGLLVGELTGGGPMIIREVSIRRLPPIVPADNDDDEESSLEEGFCWLSKVRCRRRDVDR